MFNSFFCFCFAAAIYSDNGINFQKHLKCA